PTINDSSESVFICNSKTQNSLILTYAIVNLKSSTNPHVIIDSVAYHGDTNTFGNFLDLRGIDAGLGSLVYGLVYHPHTIGVDTLGIEVFYDQGSSHSSGKIIMRAVQSPDIALFGYEDLPRIDVVPGFAIGPHNFVLEPDTLHDVFAFNYSPISSPQNQGKNKAVRVFSCDDVILDTIYTVGDFSELEISDMPTFPYHMGSNDSLVLPYRFTPQLVGTFPHYLVFHTTTGKNLVWSFEYTVDPTQYVSATSNSDPGYYLFPNPARNSVTLEWKNEENKPEEVKLYSLAGLLMKSVSVLNGSQADSAIELSTADLSCGEYNVIVRGKNTRRTLKLIIAK
ncbi:MAG: T9SS type A sorting domain-containing protein, partial [Bacteroidota bacterium]|nr:T9SS type A sorting domain-containing protein [Bacteroidota bacterium]